MKSAKDRRAARRSVSFLYLSIGRCRVLLVAPLISVVRLSCTPFFTSSSDSLGFCGCLESCKTSELSFIISICFLLLHTVSRWVRPTRRGVLPLPSPSVPPGLESLSWTAADIQLASEASFLINDLSTGIDHSSRKAAVRSFGRLLDPSTRDG